jgi:hypothetical protein
LDSRCCGGEARPCVGSVVTEFMVDVAGVEARPCVWSIARDSRVATASYPCRHHHCIQTLKVRTDAGTVRVFRQKSTLEDAIGSHACSLEANMRVTNGIPLGCPLLLPVDTVICVQTLKVAHEHIQYSALENTEMYGISPYGRYGMDATPLKLREACKKERPLNSICGNFETFCHSGGPTATEDYSMMFQLPTYSTLGAVRVFRQDFALEDAFGSHACSLAALTCVWPMAFLSGVNCLSQLLPQLSSKHDLTMNSVTTSSMASRYDR